MAQIQLEQLVKRYGDVEAVRGIDLHIPDGKVTVLVGPSGCGKTTTLRLIAGLEASTSGTIHIGDRDVTDDEPKTRDLAMVFQNYALYPHMTVRDNIAFGLRAHNVRGDELERRVRAAAEMLSVDHLLERKPGALSGGQQQRVAIGRAIVREPAAFLFDEPLSNLDAKLRVGMRTEILRLQRELGSTIVHVTHDQEEAMTLAHHVVVMNAGMIEQVGTPAEVYNQPATEFVARFIGSPEMNVVDSQAARDVLGMVPEIANGTAVRVGIRPEDVQLGTDIAGHAAARFMARVEVVELLGANAILTLRKRDDGAMKALVGARSLAAVHEGEELEFAVERTAVTRFDGAGRRVT
jgi:ABC-type sugar transport system ATPase subunit